MSEGQPYSIEGQFFFQRATTEQCPFAIIIMCVQSIAGVIIQACMAGVIFAKFTVPRYSCQIANSHVFEMSKSHVTTTMLKTWLKLNCFEIQEPRRDHHVQQKRRHHSEKRLSHSFMQVRFSQTDQRSYQKRFAFVQKRFLRVSDLRKSSLLEAHVRMIIIRKEKTEEGEVIPYQQVIGNNNSDHLAEEILEVSWTNVNFFTNNNSNQLAMKS